MRTIKLFCRFRRNVEAACHKPASLMRGASSSVSRDQKTPPLNATSDECHQLATVRQHSFLQHLTVAPWTTRDEARCWSKIAIFHTPTCIRCPIWGEGSRQNIAIRFGVKKLEWSIVKKICKYICFDRIHERDRRRDGDRTTAHGALVHCIARQKYS